jgi:serine/threonine protein kinase
VSSVVGRGPMGITCEGESSRGRQVTLKLIPRPAELSVERFAWLVREALAMAHFDHANVAAGTDFGALEDGGAFVSRARVPGVPLRALLRQGPLPLRRALDLGRQIATALAAAHAQEIYHGRLKPENVLVQAGPQSSDLVKVVDFGMSVLPVDVRMVAPSATEARRLALRTRIYLPNVPGVEGLPASSAVDVYSLGVVLFEMIAGQPPFVFENGGWPSLERGPLRFSQCSPPLGVPAAVDDLVASLLVPDAGVSASLMQTVLEGLLGRPSVAPVMPPEPEPVTSQRASVPPVPPSQRHNVASPERTFSEAPPTQQSGAPAQIHAPAARVPSYPSLPPGYPGSLPPSHTLRDPAKPFSVSDARPSGSYPPMTLERAPSIFDAVTAPPPASTDEDDTEFRPSLMVRLKRMFGRSKPGGGL